MKFNNKKVIITGGDRGIGKELVKVLINKGVADFAIMSRSLSGLDALNSEFPAVNFIGLKGNVADSADIKKAVAKIMQDWGSLDMLVHNAGVVSAGSLLDMSDEDISTQIQVNLIGPALLTKHCIPLLKKSDEPQIINLSSGLGLIAMPFYSVYAITKAGIRQFSDAIRREFAPDNIHILCVYPTATDTDMMENSKRENMDSPEMVAKESIAALERGDINIVFGGRQR
ncbi:SDR family oxidoreductase [Winogradskyella maritima]|uniref:SDR family NAD(P)-dependent oxidoreductase n=1 Tax=Winogradskyella maritima TaxID=1517766 RepID=A0ABV8AG69_9FLAO|nr:SDR family oxidoreductase [Winogradskyella maritima]